MKGLLLIQLLLIRPSLIVHGWTPNTTSRHAPSPTIGNYDHPSNYFAWRRRQSPLVWRVFMGGYFQDPGEPLVDQSNTHMVFGMRCVETTTATSQGIQVIGLQPILEEGSDDENNHPLDHGPAILEYLQQQQQDDHPPIQRVLEVGDSSAGLTLAREDGTTAITYCHPDAKRLLLLEHAHKFLNPPCHAEFKTHVLPNNNHKLPPLTADLVVFTTPENLEGRLHQVMELPESPRILMPSSFLSPNQLQNLGLDNYKENNNGVLEIWR